MPFLSTIEEMALEEGAKSGPLYTTETYSEADSQDLHARRFIKKTAKV